MKYLNNLVSCIMIMTLLFLMSCDDEKDLNLNLTETKNLLAPEDNASIVLKPAQGASLIFQWDQAYAEDGSLVLYEVVFDQVGGDFSTPFYTSMSNGKGVENKLSLTHSDLNQIAKMGGADFFEQKQYIWTVLSSKGSNIKKTAQSRNITLERPGGFDVLPGQLFITGSATEAGTDAASALQMTQTATGKFEVYTKLTAGTYKFLDAKSGTANAYFITEKDGVQTVSMDGETSYAGEDKVYRIKIDFNALSVQIDEVKQVSFWYCWENKFMWDLPYAGKGVFAVNGVTVTLSTVPWGLEERHKYRVLLNNGSEDVEEWWGYVANDSPGQDGKYGTTAADYFYAFRIENSDQWNYAWKLDRPKIQGKVADFKLNFAGDSPYAMEYVVH